MPFPLDAMNKYGIKVHDLYGTSGGVHQKKYGLEPHNVHYSKKGCEELSRQIVKGLEDLMLDDR